MLHTDQISVARHLGSGGKPSHYERRVYDADP